MPNRNILSAFFGLLITLIAPAAAQTPPQSATVKTTYVTADAMVDVDRGRLVPAPALVIEGDTIIAVGTQSTLPRPSGAAAIALDGQVLLPGFIDMHTHLTFRSDQGGYRGLGVTAGEKAVNAIIHGERTLAAGFTTVRNLGSGGHELAAVRDAIARGAIDGPRIFMAGIAIGGTGGHCSDNNLLPPRMGVVGAGVADGPWALRAKVRENIKYGSDLIKICPTGGVLSKGTIPGVQQMTEEEIRAVVEEAHMRGLRVAAHAHGTNGIKAAIRAGVDTVDHASFLDDEAIRMAKRSGVALSMDIYNTEFILSEGEAAGILPESLDKERVVGSRQRESFTNAVKAGVTVVFGSDAAVYPHGDNPKQFSRMVRFGMTEAQAIRAATTTAAKVLGQENRLGRLAPGFAADIVAVPGNPLDDITRLEQVEFVMKDGRVFRSGNESK